MDNEQTPEKTVIDEVIVNLITRTATLEKLQLEKSEILTNKIKNDTPNDAHFICDPICIL